MNPAIHPFDIAVVLLYFASIIAVGFFRSRGRGENENDYLLAGRKLTLVPFTASLVATWYGGILGVGEFTYQYGLSNWVVFGLPYYLFAFLFAIILAPRIRRMEQTTIPDRFYSRFGRAPGILSAVFVMILSSPAPYILSIGVMLHLIFGISVFLALLAGTSLSLIYIYHGGFRSVVRTDVLQFGIMFTGFAVVVILAVARYGGYSFLVDTLPGLHLSWSGGHSTFYLLVWFFIALWTFVDPGFYQRCAAASTPGTARNGIFLSVVLWAIFDFLTLSTGLYAKALLPPTQEPILAIPALGIQILPPILLGLFLAGILSTIMSTVDSFGFISAITFGRDLVWRNRPGEKDSVAWTKAGLVITGIASLLLAWGIPSVVNLWYAIGSVAVPGLLIPFLMTFGKGTETGSMTWMMALPAGISLVWFLVGVVGAEGVPDYPLGIEPFYPGLAVSAGWFVTARVRRKAGPNRTG